MKRRCLTGIATKYRKEQEGDGKDKPNFMRQYYDVYSLLNNQQVLNFIGTSEYEAHKQKRFPGKDREVPLARNEAFRLTDKIILDDFKQRYTATKALYYRGQPEFDALLERIGQYLDKL